MPIAAMQAPLKSQMTTAFKYDRAAKEDLVATTITASIAGVAPAGLFPVGVGMVPLVPAGFAACKAQIKAALSMARAAKPNLVAQQMATGISLLCPLVPPAGLAVFTSQAANAFKLGRAAKPDKVADIITQATIVYFQAGGVV